MSSSAWSGLNKDCDILELHDKFPNPKRGCQKIITFTPNHYILWEYRTNASQEILLEALKKLGIKF